MLAFDSALYLGMRHPAAGSDWESLTTGQPAAYAEDSRAEALCAALSGLAGAEACILAPSTLHLFWDVFPVLARGRQVTVLVDSAAYPVARWCAGRIGAPCTGFRHGDVAALERLARQASGQGRTPVILADGYTPGEPVAPPLAQYARCARRCGGWLVVDDTQAIGLLGRRGGGSLAAHGLQGDSSVVAGASLAKAFGAPLAALFGPMDVVERYGQAAETRVHCSPPSSAALAAGLRAVKLNALVGDALRARLARAVDAMRWSALRCQLTLCGGGFPVQVLAPPPDVPGAWLHRTMSACGVQCLVQRRAGREVLVFLLTARHEPAMAATAMRLAAHLIDQYRRKHGQAMRMRRVQRLRGP